MPIESIVTGYLWPRALRTYPEGTADAGLLDAFATTPKLTWASQNRYQTDDGGNTATEQYFATRVRANLAGGKWKAIAIVMLGAGGLGSTSPVGAYNAFAKCRIQASLELANGTQTTGFNSPNTGGTILPITFDGAREASFFGGNLIVSDLVYASSAGLEYFQITDRTLLPWIRIAFGKTNANDLLPAALDTNYNFPSNALYGPAASFAAACTLIDTPSVSAGWATSDSLTLPSCFGLVGIAADGQMAILADGTSIGEGVGDGINEPGNVNPSGELNPANYDAIGWPMRFGQDLATSAPVLSIAMGSTRMAQIWGDGTDSDWTTTDKLSLNRALIAGLAPYFDIVIAKDVNNDQSVGATNYAPVVRRFCRRIRRANPKARIYGVKVPCGGPLYTGADSGYSSAGPNALNAVQAAAASAGYLDGILNLRDTGTEQFPNIGVQRTSTVTASTTTSITDSSLTDVRGFWVGSYITIAGETRVITGNAANGGGATEYQKTLTLSPALTTAPAAGTTYTIAGNTSSDGLHPNALGHRWMGRTKFKAEIQRVEPAFPFFTRTK